MNSISFAELEKSHFTNVFARNIIKIEYQEYKNRILKNDSELIESLFFGDIYIVKNAYKKKLLEKIRSELHEWGTKTKASYHEIKEGVPNFHRILDKDGKFYVSSKWHGYYFFNFNKDPWNIFNIAEEKYFLNQKIMGFNEKETFNNSPKDKYVTRVWIVQYPQGGGYIQAHDHSSDVFCLANIAIMSEKGKDYNNGGIYFIDENANKIFIDDQVEVGDLLVTYKRQVHGVDPVDPNIKTDWKSEKGRWVMMYGNVPTNNY